jgi:hypothetical protein
VVANLRFGRACRLTCLSKRRRARNPAILWKPVTDALKLAMTDKVARCPPYSLTMASVHLDTSALGFYQ